MINCKIADDIIKIRKRLNMSQIEFGKLLGINQKMVSHLESGKAGYSVKTLEKIAKLTGARLEVSLRIMSERKKKVKKPNVAISKEEAKEIRENIDWFRRLDPVQKIRAVEMNNRATRRLLSETCELCRSD
ncbi:MAG: DNA-binding transcriptional repressor PuuR [Candidatus Scalindua rubra]|uniref:DNA-binding transcriptional repressor PuuR n=1 Tax=Candidatus Scalindua rubra TaxID=1872076 RepID=A0A1E3X4T5_9BACT|nr:MAG: DNA-binding transcriptional repressor PuuR [Candidatus Scalindua rubra]